MRFFILLAFVLVYEKNLAQAQDSISFDYKKFVMDSFGFVPGRSNYLIYGINEEYILLFNEESFIKSYFFSKESRQLIDSTTFTKNKIWTRAFDPKCYRQSGDSDSSKESARKFIIYLRKDNVVVNLKIPVLIGHGNARSDEKFPINKKVHNLLFNHLLYYQTKNK